MPMGQPSFSMGYGRYPGYAPPIFVLPPQWGPQGGTNPLPLSLQPPQSTGMSGSAKLLAQPGLSAPALLAPELTKWLTYLDTHSRRNQDGIVYTDFGPVLKQRGFYRLHHLSRKYIQLLDLQDWLHIDVGTAINIFEYAEEDLAAAKVGTLDLHCFDLDDNN
ncbi:hypothetical protein J3R83DRAFT_12776 [Lanmaoa asiatica]|nr:hypothetical protein J3R83DRAFT_12776 [Lanmaoa asiatica]